tara:strand:- start:294 stop:719 length:426 start_codon:yes stop_codon:yes gene_type:complete
MSEFKSVFDLGGLWTPRTRERELRLLLVTSNRCPWCDRFKPLYNELQDRLGDLYQCNKIEAEKVGGRQIFREAFRFFFRMTNRSFPSLYIIEPGYSIVLVPHPEMAKDFNEIDEDKTPAFDLERLEGYLRVHSKKRNEQTG